MPQVAIGCFKHVRKIRHLASNLLAIENRYSYWSRIAKRESWLKDMF